MFAHILLASDGSPCAFHAASVAAEVARKFGARLTILTVYRPGLEVAPGVIEGVDDSILADTGRVVGGMGVAYQCRKKYGTPADRIAEVAEELHGDLIVLGSRGRGGVKSFPLGSISDRVTHRAHCPVLIVR